LLCVSKRRSGVQGQSLWSVGQKGEAPPEAETLSCWRFNESRKFACFLIFENAKKSQISLLSCKNDV